MKKSRVIVWSVLLGILLLIVNSQLLKNLANYLNLGNYFIPDESDMMTFKATKINKKKENWEYGQDHKNYYSTVGAKGNEKYHLISKRKAKKLVDFDRFDYATWGDYGASDGHLKHSYFVKNIIE